MSIKPSVVFIKGVHSTTGHDTDSDIGFPQLELEKLFEGATIKVTADTAYDSSKQYIYYNSPSNPVAIQDAGHFNCIKNRYYSIANGINHYYTKSGNNYNYNTVPSNVNTWAGKWSFSNTIKGIGLYSISPESERICVSGIYYKKSGNNYAIQTVKSYNLYKESFQVLCDNNHKYTQTVSEIDDNGITDFITTWKKVSDNTPATTGFYLLIDKITDTNENQIYNVKLCNLSFDTNGVSPDNLKGIIYKLEISNLDTSANKYVKNDNNLVKLELDAPLIFTSNPASNGIFYVYQELGLYTYPNTEAPKPAILYTDPGSTVYKDFNIDNFPVYETATITEIPKTSHASYTIYEKTAVKINYNYSGDANSLKFIFTDKDIDGVLEACNLPDDIKKYVHLTNLKYNEK